MTDHDPVHDEPDRVDALASAVLDGLLPGDEAAAARRDPAVARRIDQMAAARDLLRDVPPPDAARREATIAAALAAAPPDAAGATGWAAGAASTGAVPPAPPMAAGPATTGDRRPPPPASLHEARTRRARRLDARWLGTAAAVVLLLGLVGLFVSGGSPGDDAADQETSAAAPESSERAPSDAAEGGGSASAGEDRATAEDAERDDAGSADSSLGAAEAPDAMAEPAPGAAPTTAPPVGTPQDSDGEPGAVELGSHATESDLAAAARRAVADPSRQVAADEANASPGVAIARSCPVPAAVRPAEGSPPLALVGGATLAGEPVGVWVGEVGGTPRLVAVDARCTVVVDRPLPG